MIWAIDDKGHFIVKNCYRALSQELHKGDMLEWTMVWKLKIPPKIKMFFWQTCMKCLPTVDALQQMRVQCPTVCQVCSKDAENIMHIFMFYDLAKQCWNIFDGVLNPSCFQSVDEWFLHNLCRLDEENTCLFITICWKI